LDGAEEAVKQVQDVLGHDAAFDRQRIVDALYATDFDIDRTIDRLLSSPSLPAPAANAPTKSGQKGKKFHDCFSVQSDGRRLGST
jgi:hypothetical protein